jgi:hypothetical protein
MGQHNFNYEQLSTAFTGRNFLGWRNYFGRARCVDYLGWRRFTGTEGDMKTITSIGSAGLLEFNRLIYSGARLLHRGLDIFGSSPIDCSARLTTPAIAHSEAHLSWTHHFIDCYYPTWIKPSKLISDGCPIQKYQVLPFQLVTACKI